MQMLNWKRINNDAGGGPPVTSREGQHGHNQPFYGDRSLPPAIHGQLTQGRRDGEVKASASAGVISNVISLKRECQHGRFS